MASKKKRRPSLSKSVNTPEEDAVFLKLMDHLGVREIPHEKSQKIGQESKASHKPPAASECIEFDDSFEWSENLDSIAAPQKFTAKKKRKHPKSNRKLKINRRFTPDEIIDLHGKIKNDALTLVHNRLSTVEQKRLRSLLIITGKGLNSKEKGGVLGKAVWNWLKRYQLEYPIQFQWAPEFLGGKGAILVLF